MNLAFANLQSSVIKQAREERHKKNINKKYVKAHIIKSPFTDVGVISQNKLTEIMNNKNQRPTDVLNSTVSNREVCSVPRAQDPVIDEAIKQLIDLNKDKLTESQLVDLLASFYFVTDKLFSKKKQIPSEKTNFATQVNVVDVQQPHTTTETSMSNSGPVRNCVILPTSTLRERKRLQWKQENDELNSLKVNQRYIVADKCESSHQDLCTTSPTNRLSCTDSSLRKNSSQNAFQYSADFAFGDDPKLLALKKENQRLQWVAELDKQVNEKQTLLEIEKNKRLKKQLIHESSSAVSDPRQLDKAFPIQSDNRNGFVNENLRDSVDSSKRAFTDLGCSELSSLQKSHVRGRGLVDLIGNTDQTSIGQKLNEDEIKESKRLQWVSELDKQVNEKRLLKELEQSKRLQQDTIHDNPSGLTSPNQLKDACASELCTQNASENEHQNLDSSKHSFAYLSLPESSKFQQQLTVNHARGRGLADLAGICDQEAIQRKQRQIELQVGFDSQVKEKALQRKADKARLLREEQAETERILRERDEMQQDMNKEKHSGQSIKASVHHVNNEAHVQPQSQLQTKENTAKLNPPPPSAVHRGESRVSLPKHFTPVQNGVSNNQKCCRSHIKSNKYAQNPTLRNSPRDKCNVNKLRTGERTNNRNHFKLRSKPNDRNLSGVLAPTDFNSAVANMEAEHLPNLSKEVLYTREDSVSTPTDFVSAIKDPYLTNKNPPSHSCQTTKERTRMPQHASVLEHVSKIKKSLLLRQKELQSLQSTDE